MQSVCSRQQLGSELGHLPSGLPHELGTSYTKSTARVRKQKPTVLLPMCTNYLLLKHLCELTWRLSKRTYVNHLVCNFKNDKSKVFKYRIRTYFRGRQTYDIFATELPITKICTSEKLNCALIRIIASRLREIKISRLAGANSHDIAKL